MPRAVTAISVTGAVQRQVQIADEPDACPRCHRSLVSKHLATVVVGVAKERGDLEEARQCASQQCGGVFVARYQYNDRISMYELVTTMPVSPEKPLVPDEVAQLSPVFVETYQQALAAEGYGLGQIAGVGLRKALEFLVKDFAIHEKPGEEATILRMYLGPCIKEYIADPSVRSVAERAVWLGNDETHYVRHWEDRDVKDLKILIRLTMTGLDNVLLSRKYAAEMPAPKGK